MNTPVNIEEFLKLTEAFPVIDVRSPAEFEQGHIPNAHNIPLFNNDERAKVGTAYKQIGRDKAIEVGYKIVTPKLNAFIDSAKKILAAQPQTSNFKPQTLLVHCWRGGMRSEGFANFLNENGYKTHTLTKGYKAYRNFVLSRFIGIESHAEIVIIGGTTGSGKTEILKNISVKGEQVIDLESLANHKGSAFGSLGENPQPTQEQFENNLSRALLHSDFSKRIWLEDESRSIGTCQIPNAIWEKMKQAPILRINFSKHLRLKRLLNDYGKFSNEELAICILKIRKRLGPQHVKRALEELEKGNLSNVANITLTYYDNAYNHDHEKRNMKDVFFIESETADAKVNAEKIISFANANLKKQYA